MDKINILIADDEVDSCHFIQRGLTRQGFNVDVAFNGREVLDRIDKNKYDFIFLDFFMPELTGMEVAKIIKEKNIEGIIVMISGYSQDDNLAKEIGINEFLEKPFSFQQMKFIIDKYTKKDNKDAPR